MSLSELFDVLEMSRNANFILSRRVLPVSKVKQSTNMCLSS